MRPRHQLALMWDVENSTLWGTHEANEKVWKVLSQPWSAFPLSVEGLRTSLAVDMAD